MSSPTLDYFTTSRIGAKRALTPEGFLICEGVPIARTGTMIYSDREVPVTAAGDGLIHVERQPDEVFRKQTMASFEGKPVTLDHPDAFVCPDTWHAKAKGTMQNVRRGAGIEDDLLFADLLITDRQAIDEVMQGLREVSCGYSADYEETAPGRAIQRNIIGNHVALVERGRCGSRCAIGDKEPTIMTTKTTPRTFMDRIRTAFKANDQAALDEALAEAKKVADGDDDDEDEDDDKKKKAKTGDTAKALDTIMKQLRSMDARITALAKDADEEETEEERKKRLAAEKKTDDTVIESEKAGTLLNGGAEVYTGDAWADIVARAEILSPGIQVPTTDSAKTKDAACACQRRALATAYATDVGRAAITPFISGKVPDPVAYFAGLTNDQLRGVFVGASEILRARNNDGATHRSGITVRDFGKPTSPADINAANRKFWADRAAH